jgi:hypothetical protein
VISGILAAVLMQPAGVFPFAATRIRPDGTQDVIFVKDVHDKGTVLGQGDLVSLLPRKGGCVFVSAGSPSKLVAFDADGKKLTEFSKLGYGKIARPSIDPSGNSMIAEFVGEFESEVWRIPLQGKGPATLVTSINKGTGLSQPAFEMDSQSIWIKIGGNWNLLELASGITQKVNMKPLMDEIPQGANVLEVRPSHSVPKLVAVTVELPAQPPMQWIMVWDRQSGRVSRLNPVGTSADWVDWSRDGRSILFNAIETETKRKTMQVANPSGGEPRVISVIRDAGQ